MATMLYEIEEAGNEALVAIACDARDAYRKIESAGHDLQHGNCGVAAKALAGLFSERAVDVGVALFVEPTDDAECRENVVSDADGLPSLSDAVGPSHVLLSFRAADGTTISCDSDGCLVGLEDRDHPSAAGGGFFTGFVALDDAADFAIRCCDPDTADETLLSALS